MKLTIDYKGLVERQAYAHKNGISVKEFREIVGEAVMRSVDRLVCYRECNEYIAIDGAIDTEITGTITTRRYKK